MKNYLSSLIALFFLLNVLPCFSQVKGFACEQNIIIPVCTNPGNCPPGTIVLGCVEKEQAVKNAIVIQDYIDRFPNTCIKLPANADVYVLPNFDIFTGNPNTCAPSCDNEPTKQATACESLKQKLSQSGLFDANGNPRPVQNTLPVLDFSNFNSLFDGNGSTIRANKHQMYKIYWDLMEAMLSCPDFHPTVCGEKVNLCCIDITRNDGCIDQMQCGSTNSCNPENPTVDFGTCECPEGDCPGYTGDEDDCVIASFNSLLSRTRMSVINFESCTDKFRMQNFNIRFDNGVGSSLSDNLDHLFSVNGYNGNHGHPFLDALRVYDCDLNREISYRCSEIEMDANISLGDNFDNSCNCRCRRNIGSNVYDGYGANFSNIEIQNSDQGITVAGSEYLLFDNITITHGYDENVSIFWGSNNIYFVHSLISNGGDGNFNFIWDAHDNYLLDSELSHEQSNFNYGLVDDVTYGQVFNIEQSDNNTVKCNKMHDSSYAIDIKRGSEGNLIKNNKIYNVQRAIVFRHTDLIVCPYAVPNQTCKEWWINQTPSRNFISENCVEVEYEGPGGLLGTGASITLVLGTDNAIRNNIFTLQGWNPNHTHLEISPNYYGTANNSYDYQYFKNTKITGNKFYFGASLIRARQDPMNEKRIRVQGFNYSNNEFYYNFPLIHSPGVLYSPTYYLPPQSNIDINNLEFCNSSNISNNTIEGIITPSVASNNGMPDLPTLSGVPQTYLTYTNSEFTGGVNDLSSSDFVLEMQDIPSEIYAVQLCPGAPCNGALLEFLSCEQLQNEDLAAERELSKLTISPNPANEIITIEGDIEEETLLNVFDVGGKKIFSTMINFQSNEISTTQWDSGIYFLTLRNGSKTSAHKILIQH